MFLDDPLSTRHVTLSEQSEVRCRLGLPGDESMSERDDVRSSLGQIHLLMVF